MSCKNHLLQDRKIYMMGIIYNKNHFCASQHKFSQLFTAGVTEHQRNVTCYIIRFHQMHLHTGWIHERGVTLNSSSCSQWMADSKITSTLPKNHLWRNCRPSLSCEKLEVEAKTDVLQFPTCTRRHFNVQTTLFQRRYVQSTSRQRLKHVMCLLGYLRYQRYISPMTTTNSREPYMTHLTQNNTMTHVISSGHNPIIVFINEEVTFRFYPRRYSHAFVVSQYLL